MSSVSFDPRSKTARGEVALKPYVRALRGHPVVVAAIALVTVALTLLFLAARAPSYEATAELLVTPLPQGDSSFLGLGLLRDSNDPTRTIQTAAGLLEDPQIAATTARELGAGWSRDRVQNAVAIAPLGESNLLAITATANEPALAARLATSYAQTSLAVRSSRLQAQAADALAAIRRGPPGAEPERAEALGSLRGRDDPTLSLAQIATPPAAATGASTWLVVLLAAVAGLTLGSLAALMIERLAPTVRDLDDLLGVYPAPILARVPPIRPARQDADGAAPALTVPPAVREPFRLLQMQLDPPGEEGARTIMITSASERDGKTTSALNLALGLVGAGQRVLLIDFDLRRPEIARRLGLDPELGIASLVTEESALGDALQAAPQLPPLLVLGAGAQGGVVLLEALNRRMPQILREAAGLADFVVIDTPPLGRVSDALRLVSLVDDLLIVARPGNTRRSDLALLRDLLDRSEQAPTGMVVLGERDTNSSSYYAHGGTPPTGARRERRLQPSAPD